MTEPVAPAPQPAPAPGPAPEPRRRSGWPGFLLLLFALAGLGLVINGLWTSAPTEDSRDLAEVGILLLILLFVGSALLGRGLRAGEIVRGLAAWVLIFVVLVAAYAYRGEIAVAGGRMLSAFAPGLPIAGRLVGESDETSVVVLRGRGGQFRVRTHVDDVPLSMLIDTGASFVTLTLADAVGAGIDPAALSFTLPIRTANGVIRAAPITIRRLLVGTIAREDVRALVAPPDTLTQSLLGMNFLETLEGYAISGDRLVMND